MSNRIIHTTNRAITGLVILTFVAGGSLVDSCGEVGSERDRCDHPPVIRNARFRREFAGRDRFCVCEAEAPLSPRNERGFVTEPGTGSPDQRLDRSRLLHAGQFLVEALILGFLYPLFSVFEIFSHSREPLCSPLRPRVAPAHGFVRKADVKLG